MRLVGRDGPLRELLALADEASRGHGGVALVVGEAGIGKTRLARELTALVDAPRGWGGCWEGMAAPPLWPWRRALAQVGASDIADMLTGVETDARAGDADASRYARFARVVERLVARRRPALLVIDDLHWADSGTVELLRVVAAEAHGVPLAIVGLSRVPIDGVAADARIVLGGLDEGAIAALAEAEGWPAGHAAEVLRLSGGNPLYAIELLRVGATPGLSMALSEVIRRRLGTAPTGVRDLLDLAAVVGSEGDTEMLRLVSGDGAEVEGLLSQAAELSLLDRSGSRWSFRHEVIRDAILDDMGAARSLDIHAAAARVLKVGDDADPARVAHHLVAADPQEQDGEAAAWAQTAGAAAAAAFSHDEAAFWYQASARRRRSFEVMLALGEALLQAGDLTAARVAFDDAAAIARDGGRSDQLATAALSFGAGLGGFEVRLFDRHQIELLEDALVMLPDGEKGLRALVQARLSTALSFVESVPRRVELSSDAVATARRLGDPAILAMCLAAHLDAVAGPDHTHERLDLVAEMLTAAEQSQALHLEALARRFRIVALAEQGKMAELDRELLAYTSVADRLRAPLYRWCVPMFRAMRALWDRRWDDARQLSAAAATLGRQADSENASLLALSQDASRAFFTDDWDTFDALYRQALAEYPPVSEHPSTRAMLAAAHVRREQPDTARGLIEGLTADGCAAVLHDSSRLETLVKLSHAVVGLADPSFVGPVREALTPYDGLWAFDGTASICWGPVRAALQALDAMSTVPSTRSPSTPVQGRLHRRGDVWEAMWDGVDVAVRDSKGIRDLAVLLANPHLPVPAVDLDGRVRSESITPMTDRRAIAAYRQRLLDLEADIDEGDADHDIERAARARAERDALLAELSRSVSLAGRPRPMTDDAERARQAVSARIRRTIDRLAQAHPALGRHLQATVRTGFACSYEPDRDVDWVVD